MSASKCYMLVMAEALTIGHITGGLQSYCKLIRPGCINLSCAVCFPFFPQSQLWSKKERERSTP